MQYVQVITFSNSNKKHLKKFDSKQGLCLQKKR